MITIEQPWGLLAGLLIPAIVVLHYFRRQYRDVVVSGLFLWREASLVQTSGRRWDRLQRSLSLLLQLLAAAVLTILLSDPRTGANEGIRHFVAVLDSSASMSATDEKGESARDRALRHLRDRMHELGEKVKVTLVVTGRRPAILYGPAAEGGAPLETILKAWEPRGAAFSPVSAVELALDLTEGPVWYYTDAVAGQPTMPRVNLVALGKPLANIALIAPRRFVEADGGQRIFVVVRNFSPQESRTTLVASDLRGEIFRKDLNLAAGAAAPVGFRFGAGGGPVTLRSTAADALAVDSEAVLAEPPTKKVRVFLGIADEGHVRRALESAVGVLFVAAAGEADMVLLPTPQEGSTARVEVVVGGVEKGAPGEETFLGPYIVEGWHPVTEGLTLSGVVWGGAGPVEGGILPLISCGDRPLLYERWRRDGRGIGVNLNLRRTNIAGTPDWPILWHNLVEYTRRDLPGPSRGVYHVGEEIFFTLEHPAKSLALWGPVRRDLPPGDRVVLSDLEQPGVYTVAADGEAKASFSLVFSDIAESDVSALSPGNVTGETRTAALVTAGGEGKNIRFLLLLLLLALLVCEWSLWMRRRGSAHVV